MYSNDTINQSTLKSFHLQGMMMRYSLFVPRLYNFCLSLGFTAGKIMPSRAFCSDESQGFPIILLAKHFGAFPFNHGRVGGVVATGRHGPHAHHGEDLMLIQASHVGYDPQTKAFGEYRRFQTKEARKSSNCGKILATLDWYQIELKLAQSSIFLEREGEKKYIVIDKDLLRQDRQEGIVLHLNKMINPDTGPEQSYSTSSKFAVSDSFVNLIGEQCWQAGQRIAIGRNLSPELFYFKRAITNNTEGQQHLEHNLLDAMPWILSSENVALTAAKVNTQVEFDRTYRSILREPSYQARNLLFIAGIHIDISPNENQVFPLTKFIPWAAYHQNSQGERRLYEQAELNQALRAHSDQNSAEINLEDAIKMMEDEAEVLIDAI